VFRVRDTESSQTQASRSPGSGGGGEGVSAPVMGVCEAKVQHPNVQTFTAAQTVIRSTNRHEVIVDLVESKRG